MDKFNFCDLLILAGGLGSRLRSEVGSSQKTMAQVGGRPFLDLLIDHVIGQGFQRIILCTGYDADKVESYYHGRDLDLHIDFSREEEKLGTGGAIKNAAELIESEHFFAMNGDSFCPLDFASFLSFHQEKQAKASIAISKVKNIQDYGSILIHPETKQITFFAEKISSDAVSSQGRQPFVNNGIYCFNKDIFAMMPKESKFSLEEDLFPYLTGGPFYGFEVPQNFLDIGTPERYQKAKEKYSQE